MSRMEILPAIDLLGGKCVRLIQGRYDRVIEYEDDPLKVAERMRAEGARWLHVIDLDGARDGAVFNFDALRRLASTGMRIQFGGGVRSEESISAALDAGAERVIIGTRALEEPRWLDETSRRPEFSGRLALGLDARQGRLVTRGWTRETGQTAAEIAEHVTDWPLAAIVYTDVGRDGTLLGPNIEAIRGLAAISHVPVIASGGVSDLEDVRTLARLPLAGVVIGRALYEQTVRLGEALAISASQPIT